MIGPIVLNRYRILRPLGVGGMARVYLAQQLDQDRQVALKVLDPARIATPAYRDFLKREAQFMAHFRHPHVVALYDAVLDHPETPCLVLEYVAGIDLAELLERHGRLTPNRVGRLLGQLCSVLEVCHAHKLVLRDLKPPNVMVADPDTPHEKVKVLDLGLARVADSLHFSLAELTSRRHHHLAGTPEYLCPEEIRGEKADHRGDLYSLGIMLFELLTGQRPFDRPTLDETLEAHVRSAPPSFASCGAGDVPWAIQQVVQACLEKDPARRPQSARQLAECYEQALGERIVVDNAALAAEIAIPSAPGEASIGPHDISFQLHAWMPESIAVMKLRGCLPDIGGEVVDSAPGFLRIRLRRPGRGPAEPDRRSGLLGWLGLGKRHQSPPPEETDLNLYMKQQDPRQPNDLTVTVVLHPLGGPTQANDPDWQAYCDKIKIDLSAYLMARR